MRIGRLQRLASSDILLQQKLLTFRVVLVVELGDLGHSPQFPHRFAESYSVDRQPGRATSSMAVKTAEFIQYALCAFISTVPVTMPCSCQGHVFGITSSTFRASGSPSDRTVLRLDIWEQICVVR